ncbi:MAG: NUDIX hydrolase [Gammaproteobacteria bacterium]|nr:NUDIX hydrolase [Gammaproteobacteria bacterium]
MKFCSQCGAGDLAWRVPEGDNRPRHVCGQCNQVFYQNPKIVVGSIPVWGDQILLCKRAIAPRYGYWTLPAGFMENAETTQEAAARETLEEAHAEVEILELYTLMNIPHTSQVYLMYRARLCNLDFSPGTESLECALYREDQIPWDRLAFPTITHTLRLFFEDRRQAKFGTHVGDIVYQDQAASFVLRRAKP